MEITVLDFEKNINFPATKELLTIFQAPCRLYSQKIKANQKNMVLIKNGIGYTILLSFSSSAIDYFQKFMLYKNFGKF